VQVRGNSSRRRRNEFAGSVKSRIFLLSHERLDAERPTANCIGSGNSISSSKKHEKWTPGILAFGGTGLVPSGIYAGSETRPTMLNFAFILFY
jgi:hypothetical protein